MELNTGRRHLKGNHQSLYGHHGPISTLV